MKLSTISQIDELYIVEYYKKYDITGYVDNGIILNEEKIQEFIKEFIVNNNIFNPKLVFLIPNKGYDFMRTKIFKKATLPKKEEMKNAIKIELETDIFSTVDETSTIKHQVINDNFQEKSLIYATCYKQESLKGFENIAKKLKYSYSLIPKNIVVGNIIGEKEKTTLLIDFGYNHCDFIVYNNNMPLLTKTLATGGNAITSIISSFKGISIEDSESLKVNNGMLLNENIASEFSIDDNEMSNIISTQIESIISEINRIKYQIQTDYELDIDNISIFGGSSNIKFLEQYLENSIGIHCEKTIPFFLRLNKDENLLFESCNYINSFAASLLAYEKLPVELSLSSLSVGNQNLPTIIAIASSLTIFAVIFISLTTNFVANKYYDKSTKDLSTIKSQYKEFEDSANSMINQINTYNSKVTEVKNVLSVMDTIDQKKVLPEDIFTNLKTHTPTKVQIDTLSFENNTLVLEGIVPDYLTLGYFIKELEMVDNFKDVSFEYASVYTPIDKTKPDIHVKNLKFKTTITYVK